MGFFDELKVTKNKRFRVDFKNRRHLEKQNSSIKPSVIVDKLDKFVIGQEAAKKALAVTYVNHLAAVQYSEDNPKKFPLARNNLVLIGPSGSGKTYLMETLAREFNIDILVVDASSYTKAGYKGNDVRDILPDYYSICKHNPANGIIFVDEIDKMRDGDDLELNGSQVQRELLKVIEGSHPDEQPMWVFGGSFSEYLKERMKDFGKKGKIGFTSKDEGTKFVFDDQELIRSGFIPEFVGRVGRIVQLNPLTKEDFKAIIKSTEGSLLYHYEKLGEIRGINLKLSAKDLDYIIDQAFKDGIGARALKKHAEELLFDRMYK